MASDLNNLFDRTLALSLQPPLTGDNLLILTNGGGVGVLATDSAERYGLPLRFAPKDVQVELKKQYAGVRVGEEPRRSDGYGWTGLVSRTHAICSGHSWVDGLVVLYCETAMTDPQNIAEGIKAAVDASGVKGNLLGFRSSVASGRKPRCVGWSRTVSPPTTNRTPP